MGAARNSATNGGVLRAPHPCIDLLSLVYELLKAKQQLLSAGQPRSSGKSHFRLHREGTWLVQHRGKCSWVLGKEQGKIFDIPFGLYHKGVCFDP